MRSDILGYGLCILAGTTATASAQLGEILLNPATGNYYAQVTTAEDILWDDARVAAEQLTHNGIPGHLATIHSPEENAFIVDNFYDAVHDMYWLGGYQVFDPAPEADPSADWMWVTGEAWEFTNWMYVSAEPNDGGTEGEDVLQLWRSDWWLSEWTGQHPLGMWNDAPDWHPAPGYLVEFSVYFHPQVPPCSPSDITTQGAAPGDPLEGVPDGAVTAADLNYFVNAWGAGDIALADVTTRGVPPGDPLEGVPDGIVSGADLNYYVNGWILGCP